MEIKMSQYDPGYDDPEIDIDCPVCNTLDVVKLGRLGRNAYLCRDCGTVFRGE